MSSQNNTQRRPAGGIGGPGSNMAPGEKPKNFKEAIIQIGAYAKTYLPAIIISLLLAIAGTIISIYGPSQIGKITDKITEGMMGPIDLGAINRVGLWLGGLYLINFLFNYIQGFVMATVTQRISKSLRRDISLKINRLPLRYFDSTSYGDILSRVTNDVDTISQTFNQSVVALVSAAVMFLGTLVMMFWYQWIMAVTAVASTFVGFILMAIIMKNSQKYFARQQEGLGKLNGHIEEVFSGHNVVRVYNATAKAKGVFDEVNEDLYDSAWKSQFLSGLMMPIMGFIGNFGYAAVCVVGAGLVMNGSITFGTIVKFMIYIRLFTQPLSQIAQAMTSLQSTAAASERVFQFLDEKELENEDHKRTKLNEVQGAVDFEHVKFGYYPEKIIIKDFSAHINAGQKVAIVGPTGAGKTTMVNLLMRFYEVNSGTIKIDGVPTIDVTRQNLHDQFCMVLQDTWLFEGTIKENIRYNKEGITDEQIKAACKAVGINHFIKTLPKGYDTILDDKASLSVGQKQLITIARAMVADAPLLILDEATSSVDTRTEVLIQEAMDKLMVGRTSFVIAHRLSTIKNADLILYMREGDILEKGTHDELLAQGGYYAELYNSQFENAS
ncbi:MAG: ABC transporter ATP-binding protein/permease [Turicibacter sp.]|nr:ABC transporter ATP-binding protein/permease [Turicibacter sp.]